VHVSPLSIAVAIAVVASDAHHELRAQEAAADTVGSCWSYRSPDARFRVEVVARGLTVPVSIAFLPDGRALVAERPVGRLSYVDPQSGALAPIEGVPPVVGQVDGGLLDVIVHPDFSRNGRIFFAYTEHTDSGNATVVERARLDANRLVDRVRLLAVHPYIDNVNQFGTRLVLDHGYLYIAIGDRELPELAQDLSTNAGKIVRLREDGSVPPDNPFVGVAGARPEIWSLGHRNPHGLAIDPRTGALWEHEHGPRGGDEINIIRAGRNYGWPVITYGIEYSGEPVGQGLTHHEGMEQPVYFYVPSIAPTGMSFYTGADFPNWRDNIFLGSLSYRHLNRVVLSGDRVVREKAREHAPGKWRTVSESQPQKLPGGFPLRCTSERLRRHPILCAKRGVEAAQALEAARVRDTSDRQRGVGEQPFCEQQPVRLRECDRRDAELALHCAPQVSLAHAEISRQVGDGVPV